MNLEQKTPTDVTATLQNGSGDEQVELTVSSNQSVSLRYSGGKFILGWSATNIGEYDWVGLYKHVTDPDSQYISGAWQWASKGSSYATSQGLYSGYQARYLIWNSSTGKYESVARTDPFPPISTCS